jgi:predicted nucleic acid-binding protein
VILVVDASAAVSLLIDPGAAGDAIAARLQDATLLASDEFIALPVQLWPWEAFAARAWELGDNLSSYDAAYVALAEQCDAVLVTRDRRIAASAGPRCRIEVCRIGVF